MEKFQNDIDFPAEDIDQETHRCMLTEPLISIQSFLSADVYRLLCKCGYTDEATNILTINGTLDWKCIDEFLKFKCDNSDLQGCVSKLAPGITFIRGVYQKMSHSEFKRISNSYLEWTKNKEIFHRAFELLKHNSSDFSILACLLLTASIERALGDVFLLKGKNVPYLLKDLLVTPELKQLLGSNMLEMLKIFMGSPLFFNIRNILWHGFVSSNEMDNRYGFFLIVLAMTIGFQFNAKKLLPSSIPHRIFVTFEQSIDLVDVFSRISDDVSVLTFIYHQSPLIFPNMRPCWQAAILKYDEKRYGESLVLLIPLLENCLRIIFAFANNCPHRVITAEVESRYVTFTEIFSETLEDGSKNSFAAIVTTNVLELLFDIFVHSEGPRIRDRLSHGEVNFFNIPRYLVKHIFCLGAILCIKFMENNVESINKPHIRNLNEAVEHYQPFYHPSSILKRKVQAFIFSLKSWINSPIHKQDLSKEAFNFEDKHAHDQCISSVIKFYKLDLPCQWSSFQEELNDFLEYWNKFTILTLYRPKIEGEVISILRRITHHSIEISEYIQQSLKTYFSLLENRKLRSRQRATYCWLLNNIHKFHRGLGLILLWLVCYLSCINETSKWTTSKQKDSIREFYGNCLGNQLQDLAGNPAESSILGHKIGNPAVKQPRKEKKWNFGV